MTSEQRLAVVIPAYNAASTIAATLRSIAQQDRLGELVAKVVLIDDCSSDETFKVAHSIGAGQAPFELWRNESNQGERCTINATFERLRGDYHWVAVLHADDIALPNWLAVLCQAAKQFPDAVSVCSSWNTVWEDGRRVPGEDRPEAAPLRIEPGIEAACGTLKRGCWWHFSGCLMNLPEFFDVGTFVPDMPQLGDLEWLVRAMQKNKPVVYVPQCLIDYRMSTTSVTSVSFLSSRDAREQFRILKTYSSLLGRDELFSQLKLWQRRLLRRSLVFSARGQFAAARQAWLLRNEFRAQHWGSECDD